MNAIVQYEEIGSPLPVETIKHQIQVIQEVMAHAMVKDTHYGVIPGCGDKPTLLKAGAEKLCLTFRLSPTYTVTKTELGGGHREYEIRCTLTHIPSGRVFGEGVGICSTHESKYRYRKAERLCPACGKAAIIKGKEEFGGGWLCFKKKEGCGAKFKDDDESITSQQAGRVDNPDVADVYNTVLKIGKKRAHVDAVLTATAASDIFAQDLEDLSHVEAEPIEPAPMAKLTKKVKDEFYEQATQCLVQSDAHGLKQIWDEFTNEEKIVLWGPLNSQQRTAFKALLKEVEQIPEPHGHSNVRDSASSVVANQ